MTTTNNDPQPPTSEIDRVKLDKQFQGQAKHTNLSIEELSVLMYACKRANVHKDPKVTDAEGNTFKTFGLWLADRIKQYPTLDKVFAKQAATEMLKFGEVSLREIENATKGQVKRGTLSAMKQDIEAGGTGDGAALKAKKAETEQKKADKAAEEAAKVPPSEVASGLITVAVDAINAVLKVIGDATVEDLQRFQKAVVDGHSTVDGVIDVRKEQAAQAQPQVPNGKVEVSA
jgi:hypothetical protein